MKKIIVLILSATLLLAGCSSANPSTASKDSENVVIRNTSGIEAEEPKETDSGNVVAEEESSTLLVKDIDQEKLDAAEEKLVADENLNLDDKNLSEYLKNKVYSDVVSNLNSSDYVVQEVQTKYYSKEYIENLAYNSQENIYFGYTQSELDQQFQGKKYVFTLGDDGSTAVQEVEEYDQEAANTVIKNVAIGTGVILICVTVSVVTGGAGTAPAISTIFAVSAKSGTVMALSGAAIGGISAGIVKDYQTGNFEDVKKAAAVGASEGFKLGAITGAVAGGLGKYLSLESMTENGLTLNEAAQIQNESKYPADVIKAFKSKDEYEIYKNAGLKFQRVGRRNALVREDIDLNLKSLKPDGTEITNLERMQNGLPPMYKDAEGKLQSYQLHHINQDEKGTLAILKGEEHQGNASILNTAGKAKDISSAEWASQKKAFWKAFAELCIKAMEK